MIGLRRLYKEFPDVRWWESPSGVTYGLFYDVYGNKLLFHLMITETTAGIELTVPRVAKVLYLRAQGKSYDDLRAAFVGSVIPFNPEHHAR